MSKYLTCVAHGHGGEWEALCLDFDLAVQGRSFPEVQDMLGRAIQTYIADAMEEEEPARSQLLKRRAPLRVRLSWAFGFLVASLRSNDNNDDKPLSFPIACPV